MRYETIGSICDGRICDCRGDSKAATFFLRLVGVGILLQTKLVVHWT